MAELKYICPRCFFGTNDLQVYGDHFASKFHGDIVLSQ